MILYADDMVIGSPSKTEVKTTIKELEKWAKENDLALNQEMTVQMTFRKGWRNATGDNISLLDNPLATVKKYKYLGITLQTTATSFSIHIQERAAAAAAIKAMYNIKNLTSLSTSTSMLLFSTKIAPIITYRIHIIRDKITTGELNKIEKIKAMFMKRAMGVGKTAPSRLVYQLMRVTYFVEGIRLQYHLPSTGPYQELIKSRDRKREETDPEFYNTTAMLKRTWSRECQDQRHVETRLAVHGFHHKILYRVGGTCEVYRLHHSIVHTLLLPTLPVDITIFRYTRF
jgi:hypothetical protein